MTVTIQRILNELGHRAWSGFNIDDMTFGSNDAVQAQTEVNVALRYLINLEDFPFKSKEKKITITPNRATYQCPEGQIIRIYNVDTREELTFLGNGDKYDKTEVGTPTGYWIDYNNPDRKLHLYPIPDKNADYQVIYNQFYPVMTTNGDTKYYFENSTDTLNMPELLQELFMDCLVLRVMVTNNKDDQDENFAPTQAEFNEAWKMFKKASKPTKVDNYTVF